MDCVGLGQPQYPPPCSRPFLILPSSLPRRRRRRRRRRFHCHFRLKAISSHKNFAINWSDLLANNQLSGLLEGSRPLAGQ